MSRGHSRPWCNVTETGERSWSIAASSPTPGPTRPRTPLTGWPQNLSLARSTARASTALTQAHVRLLSTGRTRCWQGCERRSAAGGHCFAVLRRASMFHRPRLPGPRGWLGSRLKGCVAAVAWVADGRYCLAAIELGAAGELLVESVRDQALSPAWSKRLARARASRRWTEDVPSSVELRWRPGDGQATFTV
jgi:hypothetical protein